MPQVCKVCASEFTDQVNEAIVSGRASKRSIALRYNLPPSSVSRHAAKHLPGLLLTAAEATEKNHAAELLARIEKMTTECEAIIELAKERGDFALALKAINQLRHVSGLLAQVAGVVQTGSKTLVLQQHNELTVAGDAVPRVLRDFEVFEDLLQGLADSGALPEPKRSLPLAREQIEEAEVIDFPPRHEPVG